MRAPAGGIPHRIYDSLGVLQVGRAMMSVFLFSITDD